MSRNKMEDQTSSYKTATGQLTPMCLRKGANLTQRQVAQVLDIRAQTVSEWERGGVPHLPPSKMKRLLELYQCSFDELIEAFESPRRVS